MGQFWGFVLSEKNRKALGWFGGGAVIVVAGLWTAFVHFFPAKSDSTGEMQINANCGSIGIGGSVSGATITAGNAPNAHCATEPK